jgi:hypothetical protein
MEYLRTFLLSKRKEENSLAKKLTIERHFFHTSCNPDYIILPHTRGGGAGRKEERERKKERKKERGKHKLTIDSASSFLNRHFPKETRNL